MISWLSVIFSAISTVLALLVPVVVAVLFCRRTKAPFSTVAIGALTFFVVQVLVRLPLISIMGENISFDLDTTFGFLTYAAVLAFSAALFEELGRFGAFKLFKRQGDWKNAVAMGIGHGGIESILLVGINVLSNTIILAMLAMNLPLDEVLGELDPAVLQSLYDTPPYIFLLGGIERIMTMVVHVALSVLVVMGVVRKRFAFVLMAIAAHFLLNFPISWLAEYSVWAAELYIGAWAVASWVFILRSKDLFSTPDPSIEQS